MRAYPEAAAIVALIMLLAVIPSTTAGAPSVTIFTDSGTYVAGDTIAVGLSTENPGPGMAVDVYIGLITPHWELFTCGFGGWTSAFVPWLSGIYHPGYWGMPPTVLASFHVPCVMPPIEDTGNYWFASVLAQAGTYVPTCDISFAPFEIPYLGTSDLWVNGDTGNDANDGSELSPFKTITHALDVASGSSSNPVVIHVAAGLYASGTNGETFPLNMKSWVSLLGEGRDTTSLDAGDGAYHVIVCDSVSHLTIEGFTITGGYADGPSSADKLGGGIYCINSSPSIVSNVISANNAREYDGFVGAGGGVYCENSPAEIIDNVITFNSAEANESTNTDGRGFGGGICCENCSPAIQGNYIADNIAGGDSGFGGGIACVNNSSPTIAENTIMDNSTDGFYWGDAGGGIYCYNQSSPVITSNTIAGNIVGVTMSSAGEGIACNDDCAPTIEHNTITGNSAVAHKESMIYDVYAYGGGIYCYYSSPSVVNNLIVDNLSQATSNHADWDGYGYGGGIGCHYSSPTIRNNTIADNTTVGDIIYDAGDGLYCGSGCSPTVTDCILWGNGDDLLGCSAAYSCIEDPDAGAGNIHDSPVFVTGPFGDYYLDPASPCLNVGSQSAVAAALDDRTTQADSTPDSGTVDMGYHYPIAEGEPPIAYIDSISPNPATQGLDAVEFLGHGEDPDGSVVAYHWRSDLDGILSAAEDFGIEASLLSIGDHVISFRVQDDDGLWSEFDTADLLVEPGNSPPVATIDDIAPNPAWQCEDEHVTFIGHGEDADGTVVAYEWTSDLDGLLSADRESRVDTLDLSVGEHTISFRVQDNEGAWSPPDTILLTIEAGSRLYVNAATGDDSNDGSKTDPFLTITHALDVASGTDKCPVTIFVAGGMYSETTNGESFPLVMKSWVSIIGDSSKTTILDAHSKAHHVLLCDSVANLSVEGFTITGGGTSGATGDDACGAGVFCGNSSMTIRDNIITRNEVAGTMGKGGGIYCLKSSLTIASNLIVENSADMLFGSGGGIHCEDSSPTIATNTLSYNEAGWGGALTCASTGSPTITNNSVSENHGIYGGGILCSGNSSPLITDNDITLNSAENGGGIGCYGGLPAIENNNISENEAAVGAGIYCSEGGSQTIQYNTISSNTAMEDGGGIACNESSPTILNNDIISNSAAEHGGGIRCLSNSSPTIIDNTIQANEAEFGGGMQCYGNCSPSIMDNTIEANEAVAGAGMACYSFSSPIVAGNTITRNTCDHDGGGIECYQSSPVVERNTISSNRSGLRGGGIHYWESPSLTISNNIIMDNSAGRGGGIHGTTDTATIEHNLIVHNSATGDPGSDYGGGIYCASDTYPTIRNNLIALNSAVDHGGGIGCHTMYSATRSDASPTISNNTIVGNYAAGDGDGIYCDDTFLPTIINCILWGNGDDLFDCSATYCCIEDMDPGTGNIHSDPLFQTGIHGDYYLSSIAAGQPADSDCIDMGSMTAEEAGLSDRTTQTDNAPDTGTVDMGFHYP